ncbi:unnamed protein product [Musa textilis]
MTFLCSAVCRVFVVADLAPLDTKPKVGAFLVFDERWKLYDWVAETR